MDSDDPWSGPVLEDSEAMSLEAPSKEDRSQKEEMDVTSRKVNVKSGGKVMAGNGQLNNFITLFSLKPWNPESKLKQQEMQKIILKCSSDELK